MKVYKLSWLEQMFNNWLWYLCLYYLGLSGYEYITRMLAM